MAGHNTKFKKEYVHPGTLPHSVCLSVLIACMLLQLVRRKKDFFGLKLWWESFGIFWLIYLHNFHLTVFLMVFLSTWANYVLHSIEHETMATFSKKFPALLVKVFLTVPVSCWCLIQSHPALFRMMFQWLTCPSFYPLLCMNVIWDYVNDRPPEKRTVKESVKWKAGQHISPLIRHLRKGDRDGERQRPGVSFFP